jgi:hypothetical protein
MSHGLLSHVFAAQKRTSPQRPRRDGDVIRDAACLALGRLLIAGLLLSSVLGPGLAYAKVPDKSFADPALHPHGESEAAESESAAAASESKVALCVSEKAAEMPASADVELSAPPALLKYLEDKKCADIASTASLLLAGVRIAQNAGYTTPDPLLLACLAKPESNFNDGAVGRAGERGLLQVHPCHKRSMARLGLDFTDGADRVAYACVLWSASGLKPWSTRRAAQRDYSAWRPL